MQNIVNEKGYSEETVKQEGNVNDNANEDEGEWGNTGHMRAGGNDKRKAEDL